MRIKNQYTNITCPQINIMQKISPNRISSTKVECENNPQYSLPYTVPPFLSKNPSFCGTKQNLIQDMAGIINEDIYLRTNDVGHGIVEFFTSINKMFENGDFKNISTIPQKINNALSPDKPAGKSFKTATSNAFLSEKFAYNFWNRTVGFEEFISKMSEHLNSNPPKEFCINPNFNSEQHKALSDSHKIFEARYLIRDRLTTFFEYMKLSKDIPSKTKKKLKPIINALENQFEDQIIYLGLSPDVKSIVQNIKSKFKTRVDIPDSKDLALYLQEMLTILHHPTHKPPKAYSFNNFHDSLHNFKRLGVAFMSEDGEVCFNPLFVSSELKNGNRGNFGISILHETGHSWDKDVNGEKFADGYNYLLSKEEKDALLKLNTPENDLQFRLFISHDMPLSISVKLMESALRTQKYSLDSETIKTVSAIVERYKRMDALMKENLGHRALYASINRGETVAVAIERYQASNYTKEFMDFIEELCHFKLPKLNFPADHAVIEKIKKSA